MTSLAQNSTRLLRSPFADPDFAQESDGAKKEVQYWWKPFIDVLNSQSRTRALDSLARSTGQSFKTVEAKFYRWRGGEFDWRALINRAKYPAQIRSSLPPAFVQHWRDLYLANHRDTSGLAAHELLMAQLEVWEADPFNPDRAIPGYIRPPKRQRCSRHPAGWSYRNLIRLLPDRYTRTLVRQGPKAASELLPSIPSTRVGLSFGQILYFDDSLHDTHINLTGVNGKEMRPLSFNCLEALSGSLCQLLLKPQIEGPNGRLELNQTDFFWFVIHTLTQTGYNAKDGTICVFEWRTANIDKDADFDNRIAEVTNGKVRIDRSGRFGQPAFKSMLFGGQPSGNFRFKAPIESFFNIVRNRSGWLNAPTGRNPDRAPEENYGMLQANARTQRLIDELPASVFTSLQRPIMEWEDYAIAARAVHDLIDLRRNHSLEGWAKLRFKGHNYRLSLESPWIPEKEYMLIPAEIRAAYDHIVSKPGYFDSFNLSPREVFNALSTAQETRLTKLPLHFVPVLAPPRAWQPVTVSQTLEMTITDAFIDSEPMVYFATVRNQSGHEIHLKRGQTYLRLLNPFDPSRIWIAEAEGSRKGQPIGLADRVNPYCKTDSDAVQELMGQFNHIRSNQNKTGIAHMRPEAVRRVEMHKANSALLGGKPATDAQKASAYAERGLARRKVSTEEIVSALESDPEPASEPFSHETISDLLAD